MAFWAAIRMIAMCLWKSSEFLIADNGLKGLQFRSNALISWANRCATRIRFKQFLRRIYLPVKVVTVNSAIAVRHHERCNAKLDLQGKRTFMPYEHRGPDAIGLEYLDGLYSYAMILTRNHADAEDLVQETYVCALSAMNRLRSESSVKGWLFKTLRNAWLRKRQTAAVIAGTDEGDGSLRDIAEPSKDSYHAFVGNVEKDQVQAAFQALSVKFREVILLREFEELSYHEIAGLLDCPVGTVMTQLQKARSKLRVLLTCTRSETSVGKVRNEGLR